MALYQSRSSASKKDTELSNETPLRALQLIESVGDVQPFHIVPIMMASGSAVTPADLMATKIRWAERASYTVLTNDVPDSFAPYNAVIRVSERGTEDSRRDYLAHLVLQRNDD